MVSPHRGKLVFVIGLRGSFGLSFVGCVFFDRKPYYQYRYECRNRNRFPYNIQLPEIIKAEPDASDLARRTRFSIRQ